MTAMSWHGHFSTVENIRERLHMKPSGAVLPADTMWSIAESGATTCTIMTNCYNQGENGQEGGDIHGKKKGHRNHAGNS